MSRTEDEKQARKAALKKLREARKETIDAAVLRMKEQRKTIDAVKRQLTAGGKTVPELAEGSGIATHEAMWVVAALKKYGEIAEGQKDGGYFRYELVQPSTAETAEPASGPLEEG